MNAVMPRTLTGTTGKSPVGVSAICAVQFHIIDHHAASLNLEFLLPHLEVPKPVVRKIYLSMIAFEVWAFYY